MHRLLRYRLDGLDGADWHDGSDRHAVYTNLGPGTYRFRVRAANEHGYWSVQAAEMGFKIPPTLWQRWPVRIALALLAAAAFAITFASWRARRQRQRFAIVMAERNRIAAEMHEALEQSFAALALNLGAAQREAEATPATKHQPVLDRRQPQLRA